MNQESPTLLSKFTLTAEQAKKDPSSAQSISGRCAAIPGFMLVEWTRAGTQGLRGK